MGWTEIEYEIVIEIILGITRLSFMFNIQMHAVVHLLVHNYATVDFCSTKPDEIFIPNTRIRL